MDCSNCGREYPYYYDKCPYCGTINVDSNEARQQPREANRGYQEDYGQGYDVRQNSGQQYNDRQYSDRQYNAQPYNAGYQQPVYREYVRDDEPVSIGSWIGVWFLTCIPIVGFIMLIVWACGGTRKTSLKNWARAQFVIVLIFILIWLIIALIMYASGYNFGNIFSFRYY